MQYPRAVSNFLGAVNIIKGWIDGILAIAFVDRENTPQVGQMGGKLSLKALEVILLFVMVSIYCAGIINLDPDLVLPGNEAYTFHLLEFVIQTSLQQDSVFPLWNPYVGTGLPLVGDPMLHLYNPLFTIPEVMFGAVNGFKVAIYLSFLAAALGMWYLARRMELSALARMWAALIFAFAGVPAARFFQGQYLFIASYAWLPWVFGFLLQAIQTRRRLYAGLTALALFFLFASGNYYYSFYTLLALVVFIPFHVFEVQEKRVRFDAHSFVIVILIGILALGLIAVQLVPGQELHPVYGRDVSDAAYSQPVSRVFSFLTLKETHRTDTILAPYDYYAYLGFLPVLSAPLALLALKKSRWRRTILFLFTLLAFSLLYIDFQGKPYENLALHVWPFSEFRLQTRMLAYITLTLVLLAAVALDWLWKISGQWTGRENMSILKMAGFTLMPVTALVMIFSAGDLFITNRQYVTSVSGDLENFQEAADWLKEYDSGVYYVNAERNWYFPFVENNIRFYNAWYHLDDIRRYDGIINMRFVQAAANYEFLRSDVPPPADAVEIKKFESGFSLYKKERSLPFAFSVPYAVLTDSSKADPLQIKEVTPELAYIPNPNEIEVVATVEEDSVLTVFSTFYPGWTLKVDGRSRRLQNVGGYLAAHMIAGTHSYRFEYKPGSFYFGGLVTLFSLLATFWLMKGDAGFHWKAGANKHNP